MSISVAFGVLFRFLIGCSGNTPSSGVSSFCVSCCWIASPVSTQAPGILHFDLLPLDACLSVGAIKTSAHTGSFIILSLTRGLFLTMHDGHGSILPHSPQSTFSTSLVDGWSELLDEDIDGWSELLDEDVDGWSELLDEDVDGWSE